MRKILHTDYAGLCEFSFDETTNVLPPSGILYCPLDHVSQLFDLCRNSKEKYVLVSGSSDYGLCLQEEHPVWRDMARWTQFTDYSKIGYNSLFIPARCDVDHCRITDKYSIKMYSFSKRTFQDIPANIVHWFCVNSDVSDSRITKLPFGVPDWSAPLLNHTPKSSFAVYCNFQSNTIERAAIKKLFRDEPDVVCEENVPIADYVGRLSRIPFIISPNGNGVDSYRILESLYSGCIPVIQNEAWSHAYDNLPVVRVNTYYGVVDKLRDLFATQWSKVDFSLEGTRADLLFWKNQIMTKWNQSDQN